MMKIIIANNGSGGVRVDTPAPKYLQFLMGRGMTEMESLDKIATDLGLTAYEIVEDTVLPDRIFRDAWEKVGANITINLSKAYDIHQSKIDNAADIELGRLNKESLRGQDRSVVIQTIKADLASIKLNQAVTVEQLNGIWPDSLPIPQ